MMRHTRTEFISETRRGALKRSGGICECHRLAEYGIKGFSREGCGCKVSAGNIFYEHIQTDYHSGNNSLENCAVLTKTCWNKKTNTYDKKTIAKTKRVRDRAYGTKSHSYRPIPGSKRSGIKLSMKPRSRPIDRETGREWGSR